MKKLIVVMVSVVLVLGFYSMNVANASTHHHQNLNRAIESYRAMQDYFYLPDDNLYHESYPSEGHYSYAWPYGQALNATLDMGALSTFGQHYSDDITNRLNGLQNYWNEMKQPNGYDSYVRPPYGQGGDIFYDDNEWIGLASLQHYYMTGNKKSLQRAKDIFKLVVSGWDDNPNHPAPGGVFWTQASWSHDRNTVSNAPGAKIGLNLYLITKNPYYLHWAKKMYNWVHENMLAPNGLFWDHIDLEGNINKVQWSYNQGTMIGANVLLYQITQKDLYLKRAESIATKAIHYYKKDNRLYAQSSAFNAIFFRNLLKLSTINHNQNYLKFMNDYAENVWQNNRDEKTNLFIFTGDRSKLLLQSGMVEIYSLLSWKKKQYKLIP